MANNMLIMSLPGSLVILPGPRLSQFYNIELKFEHNASNFESKSNPQYSTSTYLIHIERMKNKFDLSGS